MLLAMEFIVMFDGVCGLCDGIVQFLLARDVHRKIKFAALQSAFARAALERHGRDPSRLDTVYVIEGYGSRGEKLLSKGDAALKIAGVLGWPWSAAGVLALVPPSLLDCAYDVVARNRYWIFGRLESCRMPSPGDRERFIDT